MARILIVDDSPTVYFQVRKQLEADGHVADRLEAFTEFAAYLRRSKPDLILLDLEMPALSGEAFAYFARKMEHSPTPILIHSSRPESELSAAVERTGAAGYVSKDASGQRLREVVNDVLSGAKGPQ